MRIVDIFFNKSRVVLKIFKSFMMITLNQLKKILKLLTKLKILQLYNKLLHFLKSIFMSLLIFLMKNGMRFLNYQYKTC